ncbi:MAG: hypothetical protein KGL35_04425 [Bradyrhizobium sp.]|nr:hypothetical protein [Pseudomonadota bacterium]MDE2066619.1 hypothetical protein [Bradyrhizobium sp.]MDE2467988.1 hypothetical protein [Bradyrhizobium sp.]
MLAISPVDGEHNFAGDIIDVNENVDDQRTQELLARPHGDAKRVPGSLKTIGELRKTGGVGFRRRAHRQTRFKFLDTEDPLPKRVQAARQSDDSGAMAII